MPLAAGPLAFAREYLQGTEPFFVLNSDIICEFPFEYSLSLSLAFSVSISFSISPAVTLTIFSVSLLQVPQELDQIP